MASTVVYNPLTMESLPIIIENGEPKAVVMEIEQFNIIAKLLETMESEDTREAAQLARLPIFRKAVQEGLQAIKENKVRPWRKALAEL